MIIGNILKITLYWDLMNDIIIVIAQCCYILLFDNKQVPIYNRTLLQRKPYLQFYNYDFHSYIIILNVNNT